MNPDELVDVVDENGAVISNVSKRKAHEQGLLHKTVIGEIVDTEGRWLMIRQSSDRQDAGQYVSPVGGHVQSGESDETALRREAEEVTYELIGKAIFNRSVLGRHENHLFVMYKIFSDVEPVLNHESESYRYFTEQELKEELNLHPESFGGAFHFVVDSFFPALRSVESHHNTSTY